MCDGKDISSDVVCLQFWSVTSVLLWCNFLNVIMPFKFFGILVIIIYKMLIGDFFKFLIVYMIMIGGFSQAMFCLFQMTDFPDETAYIGKYPGNAVLKLIGVSATFVQSHFSANFNTNKIAEMRENYCLLSRACLFTDGDHTP